MSSMDWVELLAALEPRPGDAVLEIGAGRNAALLARRVGAAGRVVTADGAEGCAAGAPYDRVVSAVPVREFVPWPWLFQLRPGGRLVTPWKTDYTTGAVLTVDFTNPSVACGRFSGKVSFRPDHRRAPSGWTPGENGDVRTTACREADLDRMLDPAKGQFAIGARLPSAALVIGGDERRHVVELGDRTTRSYARLDVDRTGPAPWTVRQLGPRRLWDEAEAAYDWWRERGEPGADRFGITITAGTQMVWLDEPGSVVRTLL